MVQLTIRVPDEIYARLKRSAELDRRSVNSEIVEAIDRLARETEVREERRAALESISRRRKEKSNLGGDSVAMLREDRER